MKKPLFIIFCFFLQMHANAQVKDSFTISGIVRPDNNQFPFKSIKNAVLRLKRGDSLLYESLTNDSGYFNIRCSFSILNENIILEVSALNNQKRITFDSICPYQVLKSPSGYFDQSLLINPLDIKGDSIFYIIQMQSPTICYFNFELQFQKGMSSFISKENYNLDTICMCLNNQFKRVIKDQFKIEIQIFSYYSDDSLLAYKRAEMIQSVLVDKYLMDTRMINIVTSKKTDSQDILLKGEDNQIDYVIPFVRLF